jgi:hypothetical protein
MGTLLLRKYFIYLFIYLFIVYLTILLAVHAVHWQFIGFLVVKGVCMRVGGGGAVYCIILVLA